MDDPELKLIEELKAGKEDAFEAFLDTYGARLYSFAYRMCRDVEDARDVVQDTLAAMFRALKDFRGEGRFQTWLFKIAANACRKLKRRKKVEPRKELSLDDFMPAAQDQIQIIDWSQNPEEFFLRAELREVVEGAIAKLPPKYRIVLVLRDVEQFSTDEVAEILGLSPEAVKSRLHRARLYVREQLSRYLQRGV